MGVFGGLMGNDDAPIMNCVGNQPRIGSAFAVRARCGAVSLPREATIATVLPSKVADIA